MPSSPHAVIREAYRAFASSDLDALRELALPGVEVHTMTGVLAHRDEPYRGYEGLEAYLRDVGTVWDELEVTASEFHDLGTDAVLVLGRVRAQRGSTLVDSPNASLWHLRDGRVATARIFGDADSALSLLNPDEP